MVDRLDPRTLGIVWDNSNIGYAEVRQDGTFIRANKAFCDLLEYAEIELVRKRFQDITHPEDIADDLAMLDDLLRGVNDQYHMYKRYITKSQVVLWLDLTVWMVPDGGDGMPLYFVSQIMPRHRMLVAPEPKAPIVAKPRVEVRKKDKGVREWIVNNLVAVIAALLTALGAAFGLYHEWKNVEDRQKTLIKSQEKTTIELQLLREALIRLEERPR